MFARMTLLIAMATLGFAALPNTASAMSGGAPSLLKAAPQSAPIIVRYDGPRLGKLRIGAPHTGGPSHKLKLKVPRSGAPCGVLVCTWRTSGGGCLVWEKTKCKIINPFD